MEFKFAFEEQSSKTIVSNYNNIEKFAKFISD